MPSFELLAVFFGSILFGESVIVPAILLSAQGIFSPLGVFTAAFLGTVVADIAWFLLGKHGIEFFSRFSTTVKARYTKYIERVEKRDEYHRLWFFIFFKFIYGIRILTIIYFSLHRMPFYRFLLIDVIGTSLWLAVAYTIAFPAWRGLSSIFPSLESVQWMVLGIIIFAILFRLIIQWASKKIFEG